MLSYLQDYSWIKKRWILTQNWTILSTGYRANLKIKTFVIVIFGVCFLFRYFLGSTNYFFYGEITAEYFAEFLQKEVISMIDFCIFFFVQQFLGRDQFSWSSLCGTVAKCCFFILSKFEHINLLSTLRNREIEIN